VVNEIRIYLEGGGDSRDTKIQLRQGMHAFLQDVIAIARSDRVAFRIIACGSRNNAFDDFRNALEANAQASNFLLVDSEGPVNSTPCDYLKTRDGWQVSGLEDAQCHLMVQMMEAWLVADTHALQAFYGQGFNRNALPNNPNVEEIDKPSLTRGLANATRRTQKGEYHKTRHAPKILERLDVNKVRQAAPHCDRLFITLTQQIKPPR